jgi:hypothetical protein
VKGEDIDDPVANALVELKVGPAPRFSTGEVNGVFGLFDPNELFGGSSGRWNTVAAWVGSGVTTESGFPGRANGPSASGGTAAEGERELGTI